MKGVFAALEPGAQVPAHGSHSLVALPLGRGLASGSSPSEGLMLTSTCSSMEGITPPLHLQMAAGEDRVRSLGLGRRCSVLATRLAQRGRRHRERQRPSQCKLIRRRSTRAAAAAGYSTEHALLHPEGRKPRRSTLLLPGCHQSAPGLFRVPAHAHSYISARCGHAVAANGWTLLPQETRRPAAPPPSRSMTGEACTLSFEWTLRESPCWHRKNRHLWATTPTAVEAH